MVDQPAVDVSTKGGEGSAITPGAGDKKVEFTDEQQQYINGLLANQKREVRGQFADYDDLKAKAAEYDKVVEANKTEAQKQAEALAAAQAKVAEYEKREQIAAWKAEVSAESGVPANVLAGSTKEEIAAHAETLKPLISQASTGPQPIAGEGQAAALALNGDGIESALKSALGIK